MHNTERESISLAARLSKLGVSVTGQSQHLPQWSTRSKRFAKRESLEKNLLDLKSTFDQHDIRFFLAQGTLLAAIRDEIFFAHSMDCDLYVIWRDIDQLARAIANLCEQGFSVSKLFEKRRFRKLTLVRDYEWIDLNFVIPEAYGPIKYWRVRRMRFPFRYFDEGESIRFLDHSFQVPHNPSKFLTRLYGVTWRRHVYKMLKPEAFNRIRDKIDEGEVLVALQHPLWPLRIFHYRPICLTKIKHRPKSGSIVLTVSGNKPCLRYVLDTRADGSIKIHRSAPYSESTWQPASEVLARATKLYSKHGIVISLESRLAQLVFRCCSAVAVAPTYWKRRLAPKP